MKRLILILVLISSTCFAQDFKNVEYVRNYDGDTITVNIHNIPEIFGEKIGIRVSGIDTPEIRGKCQKEKDLAKEAKLVVQLMLNKACNIDLMNCSRGKYFRVVADVLVDGINIGEELLERGLAIPYDGKKKTKDWCE